MGKINEIKQRGLSTNFIYNCISQILTLLAPLVTAPYLARVLHETGNGQIAFVNSIVSYFVSFAAFGFSYYGQREIAKAQNDEVERSKVFFEILILKIVFTVVSSLSLCILIFSGAIAQEYTPLILFEAIQIIAVIFDIQFFYQGIEDFKTIAIRTIILRSIGIISVFLFVKTENDVGIYIFCFSLSILASNLVTWFGVFKYLKKVKIYELKIFCHLIPAALIFLPVISGTILSVLDSTMIGFLAENAEYENGCYSTALKLINMITLFATVDTQVLASRNAKNYAEGDYESIERHISFGFRYVWVIAIPIIVGLIILANNLSAWFLGDGFEKVPLILRIFSLRVLLQGIISVIGNQYFLQIKKENICTLINFTGILLNIILNLLLIPYIGAEGAAIASIISEIIMVILYFFFFIKEKNYFKFSLIISALKPIFASAIMGVIVYFISRLFDYSLISFLLITAIGATIYFIILILLKETLVCTTLKKLKNKFFKKN